MTGWAADRVQLYTTVTTYGIRYANMKSCGWLNRA